MIKESGMRIILRATILTVLLSAGFQVLVAQTPISPGSPATPAATAVSPAVPAATSPAATSPAATSPAATEVSSDTVPSSFRGLALGMPMDEVKALLASDGLFSYRGDIDVSLLPRPEESLIEVSGMSFVRRAFFQFYQGKLFVMIFVMNEKEMDHYAMFTSLSSKYGKPDSLSPGESVWSDGLTRLSLERPLAVKYIDLAVFDSLKSAGAAAESYEEILRSDFLGGF